MRINDPSWNDGLPQDPELRELAGAFFERIFDAYPFWATSLGIHSRDGRLPDLGAASRDELLRAMREIGRRLTALPAERLTASERVDRVLLQNFCELADLEANDDRPWAKDPNFYNSVLSQTLLSLARRPFAPGRERAESVLEVLEATPAFLETGRRLLENPPALFVQIALAQYRATVPFLSDLLPTAFGDLPTPLKGRLESATQHAETAFEGFIGYLEDELLPKASGSFVVGEASYQRHLALLEAVTTPLPELLTQGYAELDRLEDMLQDAAHRLVPGGGLPEALRKVAEDHPDADHLLTYISEQLGELRGFCVDAHLLTLPDAPDPAVVETPPFMRSTTFASIDPPGPFEKRARTAYYQITLPEPTWNSEDFRAHLEGFHHWGSRIISAHEVYPGHYAQFLHLERPGSTVRKVLFSGAFVEGWAHYTEEMVAEAGLGHQDPALWLTVAMEALERVGRYIVGIRMHTGDLTLEEAQRFFEERCHMAPVNARREAWRGTQDPYYLIYTLGKLEIRGLREKAKRHWGHRFSLQRFHDALLGNGQAPWPLLESLILASHEGP